MDKHVQLKNIEGTENWYPKTKIPNVEGLDDRLTGLDERIRNMSTSGGYDDQPLKDRIETLEEKIKNVGSGGEYDDQPLKDRIESLENREDKDTIYDDTEIRDELSNLIDEIEKKCTIVVCDNQYEFDNILTKDNNTIYLIKGDQDQWFSKEDGDELYDFYGLLLERVKELERLNGITSDRDDNDEIEKS